MCRADLKYFVLTCFLTLHACLASPPTSLNLEQLQRELHQQTNAFRHEKGLEQLEALTELNQVSAAQSQDMATRHYFDHQNPDGQLPNDRLRTQQPGLLAIQNGENIAMRSWERESPAEMAKTLMKLWADSPEHYETMVHPDFWQLGVGFFLKDKVLYATQTFAAVVVRLQDELPASVPENTSLKLSFQFHARFPKSELDAFLILPDPSARMPVGDGSSYIGKGPVRLDWSDESHFSLKLNTRYGLGYYTLLFGRKGNYYDTPFKILVKKTEGA